MAEIAKGLDDLVASAPTAAWGKRNKWDERGFAKQELLEHAEASLDPL